MKARHDAARFIAPERAERALGPGRGRRDLRRSPAGPARSTPPACGRAAFGGDGPADRGRCRHQAGRVQRGRNRIAEREQQAVAEFIAKRYRVAEDAVTNFVSIAYRAGAQYSLDPLLILAVMAIESRYNPVAESVMGARGLMQVIPKYHPEKLDRTAASRRCSSPRSTSWSAPRSCGSTSAASAIPRPRCRCIPAPSTSRPRATPTRCSPRRRASRRCGSRRGAKPRNPL